MRVFASLGGLFLLLAAQAFALTPEKIDIPFDKGTALKAWLYKPAGKGPHPLAILNHGSPPGGAADRARMTARYAAAAAQFVEWGFVVVSPLRRGYGDTGGTWVESYHACDDPTFYEAGLETAKDIAAAVRYARALPDIDASRVLLVGQSAGGWGVLAAATRTDVEVKAIVNFAGGRGGMRDQKPDNNCAPDKLVKAAGDYGAQAKRPSLWIYTENDHFFAPTLSKRMAAAYRNRGGQASYVLLPAFGSDGHTLFGAKEGVERWRQPVRDFLREQKLLTADTP